MKAVHSVVFQSAPRLSPPSCADVTRRRDSTIRAETTSHRADGPKPLRRKTPLQQRHETEDQQLLRQQTDMDKQKGTVSLYYITTKKPYDDLLKETYNRCNTTEI